MYIFKYQKRQQIMYLFRGFRVKGAECTIVVFTCKKSYIALLMFFSSTSRLCTNLFSVCPITFQQKY